MVEIRLDSVLKGCHGPVDLNTRQEGDRLHMRHRPSQSAFHFLRFGSKC